MDYKDYQQESDEERRRSNWTNPQPHYQDQSGRWVPNPNYPSGNLNAAGFVDAIKICFRKYADFNGRAPRAEFWWFILFSFILGCIPYINVAACVALFIPTLAVIWRRLHDIGKAGGWYFLGFVPLVGTIILIVWFCREGEPHPNRFGPNPYGINDNMPPFPN